MTTQRLVLLLFSAVVSAAATADAAQITTSARVQIVSGVDVERVVPTFETTPETTIAPTGAVAFHIVGPTDQAVNVAWMSHADPSPAAISRDGGTLLVWLEQGAPDGHLLIEYE
jgi:hypothetical protein